MPKCSRCGRSSFLTRICAECSKKIEAEERAEKRRLADASAAVEQDRRTSALTSAKQAIRNRLSRGERVYLYASNYIDVDSELMGNSVGSFNIDSLRKFGLTGWEIIQIIPKTVGIALENKYMVSPTQGTYGGGIGGNVVGVHVLMKKEVLESTFETLNLDTYLEDLV